MDAQDGSVFTSDFRNLYTEKDDTQCTVEPRTFHDFDAGWFAGKTDSSSAADFKLWILRFLCGQAARITFGVLVFLYLWMTFIAISLDLGAYCINAKHGQMNMTHLVPVKNPTHVAHYIDKHVSQLWKYGMQSAGILSPEEEEEAQKVEGPLQSPRVMLRGANAMDRVMVCDEPMDGRGAIFAETLGLSCLVISTTQLMEHFLRMYALAPTFFFSFFALQLDWFFAITGFCGDLAINFLLHPLAVQNFELQRPSPWVIYALFALRLWRCTMLWRMIRAFRGDFSAGSELLWVFHGMEVIKSQQGGMPTANVTKVTVIKCSCADVDDYRSKRSTLRKIHGLACSQKLLFYGTVDGSIGRQTAEDTVRKALARSVVPTVHKVPLVYGAERPVYTDSCYAHTPAGEGMERKMILLKAIIAHPEIANKDGKDAQQSEALAQVANQTTESIMATERLGLGRESITASQTGDCIFSNEEVDPPDYRFESLKAELNAEEEQGRAIPSVCSHSMAKRDVRSALYGFHERGLVLPVAIIHYTNPDAEAEIHALRHVGSRSWPDFCRPHIYITNEQRRGLNHLEQVIENRDLEGLEPALEQCRELKVRRGMHEVMKCKQRESEDAGIGLQYLMAETPVESLDGQTSMPFAEMARAMTSKQDPTFIEMKDPFFMERDRAIGGGLLCPRDLKPGCAFIDSVAQRYRRKATHFMSWVWGYKLSVVQEALRRFINANDESLQEADVFLFVCFFCNNQWRILVQKSSTGADNLESVFESRLKQIGKVVAVMDHWETPIYTQRIWTIYEQYVATKLGIDVQFTLPLVPAEEMFQRIEDGRKGIQYVVQTISKVDAENARASYPDDERKVKDMIRSSVGFPTVNDKVQKRIVQWLSDEFKGSIGAMVEAESSSSPT